MQDQKLRVDIIGDASKLTKALNTASGKLQSFGKKVTAVGQNLSMKLTLPLAIAGGAAIKMASDFDKSMTQIKTLVGIASDEVDKMGKAAIEMAKHTGISAKDAADALFFITSAGLRGSDAMDVLEQSLKASAVGLGEAKVVADLATSALNAYGIENLSAAQATDVLTASIREGKLQADSLSQSMGTVLPIASQLGVKFSEVGATFAAMSRTGTDAAVAATQIRGVLFALLKPTEQAKKTLLEFGLSAAELRKKIKEDGLLSTLKLLTKTFGDNEEAQGKVFANTRALSGVLDLMGNNLASTEKIYSRMNNTVGITAGAFTELEKSASFKLDKSLNDLSVAFSEIGGVLLQTFLPLIQDISSLLVTLSNKFQSLNPTVQKAIVIFTALVAAAGPLLIIIGSMSSGIALVSSGFAIALPIIIKVATAFKTLTIAMLSNPVGAIAAGVAALVAVFVEYLHRLEPAVSRTKTFFNILKSLGNPLKFAALQAEDAAKAFNEKTKAAAEAARINAELKKSLKLLKEPLKETTDETEKLTESLKDLRAIELKNLQFEWELEAEAQEIAEDFNDALGDAFSSMNISLSDLFKKNDSVSAPDMDNFDPDSVPVMDEFNTPEIDLENILNSDEHKAFLEKLEDLREKANIVGQEVSNAFSQMSTNLVASLGLANEGFQGFLKGLIGTIVQLIAMMLSAAVSQAIMGATASGTATGPAAIVTTPAFIATAVGGVMAAFAAIPKFANGGIVSGPTMGMMGEYPGAKANPEVIAPLDKLKGMMGGGASQNVNVGGEFKINGQDLVVALQRADRNRSRIK